MRDGYRICLDNHCYMGRCAFYEHKKSTYHVKLFTREDLARRSKAMSVVGRTNWNHTPMIPS